MKGGQSRFRRKEGLSLFLLCVAGGVHAQSLAPRSLFIDDRGTELFDTEAGEGGIRAGGFDVRMAAGLSFGYDTNVYATPDAEDNEALTTGEAHVTVEITIGERIYTTGVTFFGTNPGSYSTVIP